MSEAFTKKVSQDPEVVKNRKNTLFSSPSCDGDSRSVYSGTEENDSTEPRQLSSEEIKNLVQVCSLKDSIQPGEDFSSLAFISKKLNEENKELSNKDRFNEENLKEDDTKGSNQVQISETEPVGSGKGAKAPFSGQFEAYIKEYLPEVQNLVDKACTTMNKSVSSQEGLISSPNEQDVEGLVAELKEAASSEEEDILAFSEGSSATTTILKKLYLKITGSFLLSDSSDNICLALDLEEDKHREFMTAIAEVKLPTVDTVVVENFYEGDDDLECFLSETISSVNNLILKAEGFCVDFHDYWEKLQEIDAIKNLYLKGFLIDSEDTELVLGKLNCQRIIFESWKIAVEEEFWIHEDNESGAFSILQSLHFIKDEIEEDEMKRLACALKSSSWRLTFRSATVSESSLSQEQVDAIFN